tara:strand:+ start:8672 stop:9313 length:642 start_codon:yes stop_codon:yes gene_type:complete
MKKSKLISIIKEEVASVLEEKENLRLIMELPAELVDPSADVGAGTFAAAQHSARMYQKTGDEKYRREGEQAIAMAKDIAHGQGMIADLVTTVVGIPGTIAAIKSAARAAPALAGVALRMLRNPQTIKNAANYVSKELVKGARHIKPQDIFKQLVSSAGEKGEGPSPLAKKLGNNDNSSGLSNTVAAAAQGRKFASGAEEPAKRFIASLQRFEM